MWPRAAPDAALVVLVVLGAAECQQARCICFARPPWGGGFLAYASDQASRHLYMLAFQHIAWLSLAPKATLMADYRRSTQVLTWFIRYVACRVAGVIPLDGAVLGEHAGEFFAAPSFL
jgi:hypothetical protein